MTSSWSTLYSSYVVLNHCKLVGRCILQLSVFLFRAHVIKEVSLLCVSLQNTTGTENVSGEFNNKNLYKFMT